MYMIPISFVYISYTLESLESWSPGISAWDYGNLMSSGLTLIRGFGFGIVYEPIILLSKFKSVVQFIEY